jgi:hypothetical protein
VKVWIALAVVGLALVAASERAEAQLACAIQNQTTLLGEFSDNVPPGTITPQNVRNVICSSQLLKSAGGTAVAQALFGSPTIIFVQSLGTLTLANGKAELSRDSGVTWFQVSLVGGAIGVLAGDQVRVSWFGASAPAVTFFPSGNA